MSASIVFLALFLAILLSLAVAALFGLGSEGEPGPVRANTPHRRRPSGSYR